MTAPDDSADPLKRFESFVSEILTVTKDDIRKAEEAAKEIGPEALGPPPAGAPAIEGDD
jgi:hypothetical protein